MSTDILSSASVPPQVDAVAAQDDVATNQTECTKQAQAAFLHSPPDSNDAAKSESSDSDLSDLDEEPILDDAPSFSIKPEVQVNDIGEVLPDHWSGNVPVFRPTMEQFKDFKLFMQKVDNYGMKSGIIKIIPPREWKDAQPPLDDLVKHVRVREPIKQDIMGSNGTYRQVNILHGRSYNVPQWRQLCEQSEHQPPARRGERRANADKPRPTRSRATAAKNTSPSTPKTRGRGRPAKNKGKQKQDEDEARPMTPVSPKPEVQEAVEKSVDSIEKDPGTDADFLDDQPMFRRMGGVKPAKPKTQSISARRKHGRREGSAAIDEAAFKDFNYLMDISEFTPERCEELERAYWKTLTYAPPLYGADLMGTLFDERTDIWNLNKLPNLLDVLGTKVPGVNTAYLYLGMWKATFAWHLEDVDLYSINYLHFGAPKQWYSISQADARRFEAAMKSIWPADAKACNQFLRHKAFLISPQNLLQNYGIKVNKVVSYPGEFVVTYPYGYHSGYNLGYNCAEAVNFALDSWLDMGKIAKKCECAQAQDSVWINVYEIERKMRGEETEYEETEDDDEDEEDGELSGLPTPPASHGVRFKDGGCKRKRGPGDKGPKIKIKKIKLRLKLKAEPPCCLCPNDIMCMDLLPTDDGRRAHRLCALYIPETYIDVVDGKEIVSNVANVHKDRLELKCLFCRSKRGACFQCSQKKCARAYHATCAAVAGVFIEEQDVPVFGEDGTEYKEQAFEFSCRFHRARRDKKLDGLALERDASIHDAAKAIEKGEIRQFQYYKGEIFAGLVVDNCADEESFLVDILPKGDRIEIQWKWLLLPDPSDYHLPKASAKALPMPTSQKAKDELNAKRHHDDKPRKDDVFAEGFVWAEFNTLDVSNKEQVKVDFSKLDQVWHYLGKTSTDARAQYTEDPLQPRFNPKGNYLDTIPKPPKPAPIPKPAQVRRPYVAAPAPYTFSAPGLNPMTTTLVSSQTGKPYIYKPRKPSDTFYNSSQAYTSQLLAATPSAPPLSSSSPMPLFYRSTLALQMASQNGSNIASQQYGLAIGATQSTNQQALPSSSSPSTRPQVTPRPIVSPVTVLTAPPPQPAGQQVKPHWQVHSSVYQKYPFFQVNHNRDASKYRTPYSPWGGFTNGYEGDLRAHLIANQSDIARRSSSQSMASSGVGSQARPPPSTYQSTYTTPSTAGSVSLSAPQTVAVGSSLVAQHISAPTGIQKPYPYSAVKAQYRNCNPNTPQVPAVQRQTCKPKSVQASKPFKVGLSAAVRLSLGSTNSAMQTPPKQSPVPLPANFLAAMTATPATSTSSSKHLSFQQQMQSTTSTSTAPLGQGATALRTSNNGQPSVNASAGPPKMTSFPAMKASTSVVPLPRFGAAPVRSDIGSIREVKPSEVSEKRNSTHIHEINQTLPSFGNAKVVVQPLPDTKMEATTSETIYSIGKTSLPAALGPGNVGLVSGEITSTAATPCMTVGGYAETYATPEPVDLQSTAQNEPVGFPDVPGRESMEFVERMMQNLRRASSSWGSR